jgi:diaminopimelate epimerase
MHFSKWHALGNSYLIVERSESGPLLPEQIARLCNPDTGIGSDGVLEVTSVEPARVEIAIWNPDGSQAELSGNGTRIAARWLSERFGAEEVVVSVGPRDVRARIREGLLVEQDLGPVVVGSAEAIEIEGESLDFVPVTVGNPHAVVERAPDRASLLRLGPLIEQHERFPERTNVQLMRIDGPHEITVLVWERGAGETRSSGTSACAAAAAAIAGGGCESPVTVHLPGGNLDVEISERGHGILTGPAEEICRGEVAEEFLAAPDQTATP